jgi:hypothetical protein
MVTPLNSLGDPRHSIYSVGRNRVPAKLIRRCTTGTVPSWAVSGTAVAVVVFAEPDKPGCPVLSGKSTRSIAPVLRPAGCLHR